MTCPKYYIQIFQEKVEGMQYEQPIERMNGKTYWEFSPDSFERQNWGSIYWDSRKYNDSLDYCQFNSELWTNENAKIQAFNKIYDFIKKGKSGSGSSVTQMFPFEIFMMNDGFTMDNFCELNAINSGIHIVCDKMIGDKIVNPKGIKYSRTYLKKDNFIYLAFGLETNKVNTNFYFQTSKSHHYFQVNNSIDKYLDAINGKLPYLGAVSETIS